jgi:Glyoxalase-like domain
MDQNEASQVTTKLRCSHILCKVDDIRTLVRDYEDLGFTVEWGSAPERAHNALIWFQEGPFLEFFELAPTSTLLRWPLGLAFGAAAADRLVRWARPGQGWRDLAVETDTTSLTATRAELRDAGVATSRVIKGKRTRPDGQVVRYQMIATRPAGLPFVVSAYDPPQRPPRVAHPNGARGVHRVRIGVASSVRQDFDAFVANDPCLAVVPAAVTGPLSVELAGLTDDLDESKLHGAVMTPATESPRKSLI